MGISQQTNSVSDASLRRVAIVLSSVPTSIASQLLQGIDSETQNRIQQYSKTLAGIEPAEREEILHDFREQMFSHRGIAATGPDGELYQDEFDVGGNRETGKAANLLNTQVASVVSQWDLPRSFPSQRHSESPFDFLDDVDDDILVQLLSEEHPQTIALVFASITPKQAARVLPRLDTDVQNETVRRIGRLDDVPEATATDVAAHLRARALQLEQSDNHPGYRTLRAIVNQIPYDEQQQEAAQQNDPVAEQDTDLDEDPTIPVHSETESRSGLSTDDVQGHLLQLSPRVLCQALGRVKTREALLALCGLPNEVAEQTLSLLPRSKAKEVRRGMANLTSVSLRDIDDAKESVALASLEFDHSATMQQRSPAA